MSNTPNSDRDTGPVFLPEVYHGDQWSVGRSTSSGQVDLETHVAVVPPPLNESLEQFRMHLAAKVKYSTSHVPPVKGRVEWIEGSLEELRIDTLLHVLHGTAQFSRLDEINWDQAPHPTNAKEGLRLIIETWAQQDHLEKQNTDYHLRLSQAQAQVGEERWKQIEYATSELITRIQQGEDGLDWRREWAERLADIIDPPPPPPPPPASMVPNEISQSTLNEIKKRQQQVPPPPSKPQSPRKVLRKIEKPKPEPQSKEEEDAQQPRPQPQAAQNNAPQAQSETETSQPSTSDADEGMEELPDNDAEQAEEDSSEEGGNADESPADEEDIDSEGSLESDDEGDGEGESEDGELESPEDDEGDEEGSESDDSLDDDADEADESDSEADESEGDDEEGGSEEAPDEDFASEYEEVDAPNSPTQVDSRMSSTLQAIAKNEGGMAMFDPTAGFQPGGKGNSAMIGRMAIHDHLNGKQRTHSVRQPGGARDRGQIPVHIERYTSDKAIFTNRRRGGTIVIDGSGSMNWDPDKLDAVLRQVPAATVAIYHGSETDWVKASGFGIQRTDRRLDDRLVSRLIDTGHAQEAIQLTEETNKKNNKAHESNREILKKNGYGIYRMPQAPINGTLCIIGRDGKWGPMLHNRGGSNEVDVEALLWLALQKGPRIWITDGEVHSGYYASKYLHYSTQTAYGHAGDIVRMVCDEVKKRHKITEVRTVEEALKILGVKSRALEALGV